MRKYLLPLLILLAGCGSPSVNDGGMVGQDAPEFEVQTLDLEGKRNLSDSQGKVVLLDFWATWCGPCKSSKPEVHQAYEKHRGNGFEVVAISAEEPEVVREYMKHNPSPYPVFLDVKESTAKPYMIESYPTFILIDRKGKVVADIRGYMPGEVGRVVDEAMR